ncbi:hypothetical protein [Hoeflea sp.]|uniref:hypothetical protein n=1 Tax=Hoeflea sp. TaxID=1940281 RepID=UPI003A8CABBD
MDEEGDFLTGIVFGTFLSVPVALFIWSSAAEEGVDLNIEWETLLAGAAALFGAIFTVRTIRRQISSYEKVERVNREKKLASARAVLPLALSDIVQFCSLLITWILGGRNGEMPTMPAEVTEIIREVIEWNDSDDVHVVLSSLVSRMQVVRARLRPESVGRSEWNDRLVDAVELTAMAESLFDYARQDTRYPREFLSRENVLSIMRRTQIPEDNYTHAYNIVRVRNYENSLSNILPD